MFANQINYHKNIIEIWYFSSKILILECELTSLMIKWQSIHSWTTDRRLERRFFFIKYCVLNTLFLPRLDRYLKNSRRSNLNLTTMFKTTFIYLSCYWHFKCLKAQEKIKFNITTMFINTLIQCNGFNVIFFVFFKAKKYGI